MTDQYDTLFRVMEEGLIVQVNSVVDTTGTSELIIEESSNTTTDVLLRDQQSNQLYNIYRDDTNKLLIARVTEDGLESKNQVLSFSVVGIKQ